MLLLHWQKEEVKRRSLSHASSLKLAYYSVHLVFWVNALSALWKIIWKCGSAAEDDENLKMIGQVLNKFSDKVKVEGELFGLHGGRLSPPWFFVNVFTFLLRSSHLVSLEAESDQSHSDMNRHRKHVTQRSHWTVTSNIYSQMDYSNFYNHSCKIKLKKTLNHPLCLVKYLICQDQCLCLTVRSSACGCVSVMWCVWPVL